MIIICGALGNQFSLDAKQKSDLERYHLGSSSLRIGPKVLASDDDFSLRKFVDKLHKGEENENHPASEVSGETTLTGARLIMVNALNHALDITGRTGREVLLGMLENRHGLLPADYIDKPGELMGALRDLLGSSCGVLEKEMLRYINEETGISSFTLEETAFLLKKAEESK